MKMILTHQHKILIKLFTLNLFLLIFMISMFSCKNKIQEIKLNPVEEYNIDIQEPSGLCFDETANFLYVVGDNSGEIYKINLQGGIEKQFMFQDRDIEGITMNTIDTSLYIADETNRSILQIDTLGSLINSFAIDGNNETNNGLEGLSYNPTLKQFYIINERNPGQLIITDENFNIQRTIQLSFADDYSGIFYNTENNKLYILSDKSSLIAECNTDGEAEIIYNLNEINLEGIVVASNKFYVVSDTEKKLYVYSR